MVLELIINPKELPPGAFYRPLVASLGAFYRPLIASIGASQVHFIGPQQLPQELPQVHFTGS